jgi:hypothetical protein
VATAPKASDAISLIFDDANHSMRLVGTVGPLRRNDYPNDRFEVNAVNKAVNLQDAAVIDQVDGRYYRRSVPVSNKIAPTCVLCHANYKTLPADKQIVGVLALKVPIK